MSTPKIVVEAQGPVTTITINRPQAKNALDNEAAHGLADALRAFEADAEARVAVLTGAGGAFCAGADLKELGSGTDYFPWAGSDEGPLRAPLSKPVIGAIEGHACAGGLGVALFCDIRIVDDSDVRGLLAPLGRADERRHDRAPAAHCRPGPRHGHAADRPRGRRRRGDRDRAGHAQGGARHDARRGRGSGAADRRLPADRHDVGPPVRLRELRPRRGLGDPARDGTVARRTAAGIAKRRGALRQGRRPARPDSKK